MTKNELKERLKALNAKQWELANVIGVHEKTLIYWFHGEECTPERAERIEKAFKKLEEMKRS